MPVSGARALSRLRSGGSPSAQPKKKARHFQIGTDLHVGYLRGKGVALGLKQLEVSRRPRVVTNPRDVGRSLACLLLRKGSGQADKLTLNLVIGVFDSVAHDAPH